MWLNNTRFAALPTLWQCGEGLEWGYGTFQRNSYHV